MENTNLPKTYNPKDFESRLYSKWVEDGLFKSKPNPNKKPFTIMLPPPNITGQLHMGHALDHTLQDILVRWKRMDGYETLWQPGTDHASIATEVKVVERIKEQEGKTKYELGREEFLKRAWAWKEQYGGRIIEQLKKLGSSCDWSRERFTLDEGCSEAVREVFVRLYEKGLIYRGERIINWCPHCKTSISNAEVDYENQKGHFWHIRYPLVGGGGYVEVATTRPETLLGDTAVAVNPADERYSRVRGAETFYSVSDVEGNAPIARALNEAVVRTMQTEDRGIKTRRYPDNESVDYYGVLRSAAASGCKRAFLIEHGFHPNPEDSAFLQNSECLAKLAKAEAEVIDKWF